METFRRLVSSEKGANRQANALAPFLRDGIQVKKQKLFETS